MDRSTGAKYLSYLDSRKTQAETFFCHCVLCFAMRPSKQWDNRRHFANSDSRAAKKKTQFAQDFATGWQRPGRTGGDLSCCTVPNAGDCAALYVCFVIDYISLCNLKLPPWYYFRPWHVWSICDLDVSAIVLILMQKHDNIVNTLWDSWEHMILVDPTPVHHLNTYHVENTHPFYPEPSPQSVWSPWVRVASVEVKGSIPTSLYTTSNPSTNVLVE